jgi:hypothetical protein
VELEIPQPAICGGLARQLHIPNNFTFAQPEEAIGHESQIEPWLALTTPLLDASETDERRYASKMNLENRKNRGSSHQYMGWMSERISLRLPVAGEVFFLDIPFYRLLHPFLYVIDFKRALNSGEAQQTRLYRRRLGRRRPNGGA